MKIVALVKTYHGEEFAISSLESFYKHVSKVVYVHSSVSWTGTKSDNTVAPIIEEWKKENDSSDKIINLYHDTISQEQQCRFGFDYINKNFDHEFKMIIDTDEVFDNDQIELAIAALNPKTKIKTYKVKMYSHAKSPFFQTADFDRCFPAVFLKASNDYFGIRGGNSSPALIFNRVHMHHFCSVRKSLSAVLEKHYASCSTEGAATPEMREWIRAKWNCLPNATNVLPVKGYEHHWKSFKVITINDLPKTCRNNPLVLAFDKSKSLHKPQPLPPIPPPQVIMPIHGNNVVIPEKIKSSDLSSIYCAVIFFNDSVRMLGACLKSISENGFKIIAVDGAFKEYMKVNNIYRATSTDGCLEIAKKMANYFIPSKPDGWNDEVEKRNAYLNLIPIGQYCMWLDADELLPKFSMGGLTADCYRMIEVLHDEEGTIKENFRLRVVKKYDDLVYKYQHCRMYRLNQHFAGDLASGCVVRSSGSTNNQYPFLLDASGKEVKFNHFPFRRVNMKQEEKERFYKIRAEQQYPY